MAEWARLLSGCRGSLDRGFESRPPRRIKTASTISLSSLLRLSCESLLQRLLGNIIMWFDRMETGIHFLLFSTPPSSDYPKL